MLGNYKRALQGCTGAHRPIAKISDLGLSGGATPEGLWSKALANLRQLEPSPRATRRPSWELR